MKTLQKISPQDLVQIEDQADALRVEVAYARDDNLLFGERIYRYDAKLWLYKDLAQIVLRAAKIFQDQDLRLILYDGLRTSDAQERILKTQAVRDNPHWLEEPRLLSPPGAGAHPRGMAIDCSLESGDGQLLNMGTEFDFLAEDSSPETNPAHRNHPNLSKEVIANRKILDKGIVQAADEAGITLLALPQEWWDFRLPPEVYELYEAISDADLPHDMRMTDQDL